MTEILMTAPYVWRGQPYHDWDELYFALYRALPPSGGGPHVVVISGDRAPSGDYDLSNILFVRGAQAHALRAPRSIDLVASMPLKKEVR